MGPLPVFLIDLGHSNSVHAKCLLWTLVGCGMMANPGRTRMLQLCARCKKVLGCGAAEGRGRGPLVLCNGNVVYKLLFGKRYHTGATPRNRAYLLPLAVFFGRALFVSTHVGLAAFQTARQVEVVDLPVRGFVFAYALWEDYLRPPDTQPHIVQTVLARLGLVELGWHFASAYERERIHRSDIIQILLRSHWRGASQRFEFILASVRTTGHPG